MTVRPFLFIFLFLLLAPASQMVAQSVDTPDSLNTVQLQRPNDILRLDERWNTTSVDLFTQWLDGGLYGYYSGQPTIMLDGLPVDINFFNWQNLNMLPLHTASIQGIDSNTMPGVYKNNVAPAGVINIINAKPDTGFSIKSSFYIGNETGDPGPFLYDSLRATPNIDRWGPDGSLVATYSTGRWYGKGIFSIRNHQQTDLISNQRIHITASVLGTNQEYVNYKIQTTTKSGLLETGYRGANWMMRARAIYADDNDYLFLQAYGREIPTHSTFGQFALEGNYQTGNWLLEGQYRAEEKNIGKRYQLHTYIFDWDQRTSTLAASGRYQTSQLMVKPGIQYQRFITRAPGIRQPYNDLVSFYTDGSLRLPYKVTGEMNARLDYDEADWTPSISGALVLPVYEQWSLKPSIFYTQRLPLQQNSFSYWTNRGYTFSDELGITIPRNTSITSGKDILTGARLTSTLRFGSGFSFLLEPSFIRHHTLIVPWQIVREYEFLDTLPGEYTVTSETGSRFILFSKLNYSPGSIMAHEAHMKLQYTTTGSARYQSYFEQIPAAQIGYELIVTPIDNLKLSLGIDYRSGSAWQEYDELDGVPYLLPSGIPIRSFSGTFRTRTPAFTDVQVGLQKWFLNRHVNTQVSIQNLLNQEYRLHTMGAEMYTKFNFKVGINF